MTAPLAEFAVRTCGRAERLRFRQMPVVRVGWATFAHVRLQRVRDAWANKLPTLQLFNETIAASGLERNNSNS